MIGTCSKCKDENVELIRLPCCHVELCKEKCVSTGKFKCPQCGENMEITNRSGDLEEVTTSSLLRKMGPKEKSHPTIGKICPLCRKNFFEGDYSTMIPMGPGENPEERKRAANGDPYTAVALEVHWVCATGREL